MSMKQLVYLWLCMTTTPQNDQKPNFFRRRLMVRDLQLIQVSSPASVLIVGSNTSDDVKWLVYMIVLTTK